MGKLLEKIRSSHQKPKAMVEELASQLVKDRSLLSGFTEGLKEAKDSERGYCFEVLEYATKTLLDLGEQYLDTAIEYLDDKAPKVRWETARVVGNVASHYPDKASAAIDRLLVNTKDKGTVVRWSAAFALSEIAKANEKKRPDLIKEIRAILASEENNGVKNVYLKQLKDYL